LIFDVLLIKLILISFLVLPGILHAQQDTIKYVPIPDTTKAVIDTVPRGDIDAIVEYSAKDSAVFDIENQKLMLYNQGDLKYKEFELKAARVILYKETTIMEAEGIPDTAAEGKYMGTPVFIEGDKKYEAFKLRYNFKTRTGNITMGTTEIEGGYYLGEKIKKVADDIYFVKNGRYTTCDLPEPHYYFGSPKMKVTRGDKVVAEPVYLYVGGVPIFVIPLGIFPNHSGRSSGLVPPAYGEDAVYGRYLSHLGYFWAINDYLDLLVQGNYYTKGRLDLTGRFRYALRYKLSGSLELGGSRIRIGEENDLDRQFSDQWHIGINHNQTFNPTTSITANIDLYSSKQYLNVSSNNLNQLLLQNAVSNATLTKSWEGTPNVLTLNYHRDQNLQTGEVNQKVPSVSFSRSQTYPFRTKRTSLLDLKWYELIAYNYSASGLVNDVKSLIQQQPDSGSFKKDTRGGIRQSVQISAPIRFDYLNLSPNFNYNEVWYNKYIERFYDPQQRTIVTNDRKGIKTFRYFNTGISLNTRLIGLFPIRVLGVKGFRHQLLPSISFTYQPDFSKPFWGYYKTYSDSSGRQVRYSPFEKEVFGSPPGGESRSLGFSVSNVFEMKVKETDTTDAKFQLLNLDASASYNFAADSLRLSELNVSYRTQIASLLNIGGGASFNFYKYIDGVGRVNKFLWKTDKRVADLTSFNINVSTTLQSPEEAGADTSETAQADEDQYEGLYGGKPPDFKIPWAISLNYNYSFQKPTPSVITKSSNISASLNFSLTRKWKFSFSAGYDIFNDRITAPFVTIYRDLHCWEMNFSWIPLGTYRGYRFELRIKAPQLHDVKVEKQTNYRGAY
jgi:lipopolysaccharide assembly outer membrane protein LptD (OstA)